MPEPLLYLQAMVAAAIVSAIVVGAILRTPANTHWLKSACVLGLGLGLASGYYVMSLQLAWPPVSGLDRLLTVVVPLVLVIELIAGLQRVPSWAAWSLRLCFAAAIPRILLHGSVYLSDSGDDWTMWHACAVTSLCAVMLAGVWGLLSWLSRRSPGVSISFALFLTTQCAGLTIMMAGYIKGGAAAFPMAATLVATTVGVRLTARNCNSPPVLGFGVVGLSGLLFIGRFFGRLSTESALAILFAPLLCWVTETRQLRHRKPLLVGSIRLVLVAIPLLAVLAFAKRDFDRDMAPLLSNVRSSSTSNGQTVCCSTDVQVFQFVLHSTNWRHDPSAGCHARPIPIARLHADSCPR